MLTDPAFSRVLYIRGSPLEATALWQAHVTEAAVVNPPAFKITHYSRLLSLLVTSHNQLRCEIAALTKLKTFSALRALPPFTSST